MKIDLEEVLKDSEGKNRKIYAPKKNDYGLPIADDRGNPEIECKGDLKLKDALFESVNAQYKGEDLKPEDVYSRGKLARKVKIGGSKHFSNDEITLMKTCMVKRYQSDPILVLDILAILDPENVVFKETEEPKAE